MRFYAVETHTFLFNNFGLCLSLQDMLYIIDLPIVGKPITNVDSNPILLYQKYLNTANIEFRTGCLS